MTVISKAAVLTFALAGATLASGCMTRDHGRYGYSGHHRDYNHSRTSFDYRNVGYGYRDGYWDTSHRWHQWPSNSDRDNYRHSKGSRYYDRNHDQDSNNGRYGY